MMSPSQQDRQHLTEYRADCLRCEWSADLNCKRNMIESIAELHRSRTDHAVEIESVEQSDPRDR